MISRLLANKKQFLISPFDSRGNKEEGALIKQAPLLRVRTPVSDGVNSSRWLILISLSLTLSVSVFISLKVCLRWSPGHRRAQSPSSFRSPLWWSRCARPRCSHRSESQKKNFTLPTNRTCRKQLIRKKYLIKHKQVLLWIHSELLEGKMLENHSHNKKNPECILLSCLWEL